VRSLRYTSRMVALLSIISLVAIVLVGVLNGFAYHSLLTGPIDLLIENRNYLLYGVLVRLIISLTGVWIAILLYPIIREQSRATSLCFIYLSITTCISLMLSALIYMHVYLHAQGIIGVSNQNPDSLRSVADLALKMHLYSDNISIVTSLASSLLLCYSMFQSRIIPRYLSVCGFVGYICASLGELLTKTDIVSATSGVAFLLWTPNLLWTFIAFPLWLLIMGFNPPTNQSCREDASFLSMKGRDQTHMLRGKRMEEGQVRPYKSIGRMVGILSILSLPILVLEIVFECLVYYAQSKDTMKLLIEHSGYLLVGVLSLAILSLILLWIIFLLYPLVKEQSRAIALYFIYFTIAECISLLFIAFIYLYVYLHAQGAMGVSNQSNDSLRSVVDLALTMRQYAYYIASATSVPSGLLLCYSMFQSRIVPRFFSVWGFVGYACGLLGGLLAIIDVAQTRLDAVLLLYTPGMLFALIIFPLWLIIKGFNAPANQSYS
jgi:hypothetical protein